MSRTGGDLSGYECHGALASLPCSAKGGVLHLAAHLGKWQVFLGLVYFCGFAAMDLALSHYFGAFFFLGYCGLSLGRKLYFSI